MSTQIYETVERRPHVTIEELIKKAVADIGCVLRQWSEVGHQPDKWQYAQLTTAISEYSHGRYASASSVIAFTLDGSNRHEILMRYLPPAESLSTLKSTWKTVSGRR